MSATRIDLHSYVETLRNSIPYIHPAGRVTIDAWLTRMIDAADQADTKTFAHIAKMVRAKIDLELKWLAEKT